MPQLVSVGRLMGGRRSGAAPNQVLRAASTNNRVAITSLGDASKPMRVVTCREMIIGSGNFKRLKLHIQTIMWAVSGAPVQATGPLTVIRAYIYIRGGATNSIIPITFNGGQTGADIQSGVEFLSDDIPPSIYALANWPKVGIYFVKIEVEAPAGSSIPCLSGGDATSDLNYYFDPAVTSWNNALTSTTTATFTGTAPTNLFLGGGLALMIMGEFVDGGEKYTWAGLGDSIFAQGNTSSYFCQSLRFSRFAGIQIGRPGGTAAAFDPTNPMSTLLLKYCGGAVEEYNTNNAASGLTALQTLSLTTWANIKALKAPSLLPFKIVRTKLGLSTTGTVGADPATQTITGGWGLGDTIAQFNDWLATKIGTADGFDILNDSWLPCRANTDPLNTDYYKWKNGYPLAPAPFIHPNSTASGEMYLLLTADLPTT